ncbi:hypothetical protein SCUCBS95973_002285 [Sporothrix curviconia]|uniref:Pyruvate decarboxylase n=1 Tax=Sporothrix curviconia TaxID=1260050 RepID=A0ABP0B6G0_9PEZI
MSGRAPYISDRPQGLRPTTDAETPEMQWASDALVEQLARLDLRYIALVPGSSYRGVHDSLVNYKGNTDPQILLCLHEEHCVALAHGYAKVAERPMAAAVHANVGLMHAVMAFYNAFCDRVPMLVLGATGPVDAAQRRPWIDWVHTSGDQGALVRPFVKWDDQPASLPAALCSLVQAAAIAREKPCAPVYVCLDVELQEKMLDKGAPSLGTASRYLAVPRHGPSADDVAAVHDLLATATRPLFLMGRMDRTQRGWDARVALAEHLDARVATDLKQAAAFPTQHPLHATDPGVFNSPHLCALVRSADVIVALDWVDLAGTFKAAHEGADPEAAATVVHVTLDAALHNGWSKDHFSRAAVDVPVAADPDEFVTALLAACQDQGGKTRKSTWETRDPRSLSPRNGTSNDIDTDVIYMHDLATAIYDAVPADELCLIRLPLGWKGGDLRATHPLSYLGQDGGGGLASGPGQAVGSGLALKEMKAAGQSAADYVPVAVLGDGDFLMGSSALWTAARYKIPVLVIVANNASFFNDEAHQERVARARSRPVENKWIGVRIDDPLPDLSQNAASLGAAVLGGQVTSRRALTDILCRAVVKMREESTVVVVDVSVPPDGYSSALNKAQ